MRCKNALELFSDYAENSTSPGQARELGEHLRQCEACSSEWREFSQTLALLHRLETIDPPADLLPGIHTRLAKENGGHRFWRYLQAMNFSLPVPAAAGIFAIAMLAGFLFNHTQANRPLGQTANKQSMPQARDEIHGYGPGQVQGKPIFALSHNGLPRNHPPEQMTRTALAVPTPPDDHHHRLLSPDIHVLIKNSDRDSRMELCREIIGFNWHVDVLNSNLILVHLAREDLPAFRRLFRREPIAPAYVEAPWTTANDRGKMLTAAIRFN